MAEQHLTPDQQIRATALQCASRCAEPGAPTGHCLSSARMFETYIRTGLSQTGPRWQQGLETGVESARVRIDGRISPVQAEQIREAVTHILEG